MKVQNKQRLLITLLAAFLLLNLALLFKVEMIERFSNISFFRVLFFPTRMSINILDYFGEKYKKYTQLSQAYEMLMKEQREKQLIEAENMFLKEKLLAFERLNELEQIKSKYPFKMEVSKIISRNPLYWHQHVMIEGGKDKGFQPGMPVITKDGLVGKITAVYPEYSRVLLMVDPEFSVDVRGQDSNVLALCSGIGTSIMKINYVPRFEELKLGEMLITSGLDMSFPPGIPVGYLIEVNKPFGAYFLDANVIPVVDVLKIREVMVIKEFEKKK